MNKKLKKMGCFFLAIVLLTGILLCGADGTAQAASSKKVAKSLTQKTYNPALKYQASSRYLPDFGIFSNYECRWESKELVGDGKTVCEKYTVPEGGLSTYLAEYIRLLQDSRFHLVLTDKYDKSYGRDSFVSYSFIYNGTGRLTGQKGAQFSDKPYHLNIWYNYGSSGNCTVWLYYSPEFQVTDTLDRVGGKTISNPVIQGKSARKAVVKTAKGVYQTSDKRLSAKAGYADIIVNGKHYKKKVKFTTDGVAGDGFIGSKSIDYFAISDVWRGNDIFLSFPYNYSEDGDLYSMADMIYREPNLWETYMFHNKSHKTRLGIQLDGENYLTAWGNSQNVYDYMTVRVLDWNKKGVTLVYFAAKLQQPGDRAYTIEGLLAGRYSYKPGASSGGSSSDDDSSSGGSSGKFQKDCSICRGSGECTTCGGSGYLYSSASKKYDRNCYKCNTTGRCTYCGGTGKQKQ